MYGRKGFQDFNDLSGRSHDLQTKGNPKLISDELMPGAVQFNGKDQSLGSNNPVVDSEGSYTIAAWVRLDSTAMNGKLSLRPNEQAFTAVSQDTKSHSNFYLGARQVYMRQPNGVLTSSVRWNFCVAPIDGSVTGPVEWQHVHTETRLDDSTLDKWFLLIGVCDAVNRRALIYVPNMNETGMIELHTDLIHLPSEGGLQIGRGRWLGNNVDFWPGSVGPVRVYSGAMDQHEARELYAQGKLY